MSNPKPTPEGFLSAVRSLFKLYTEVEGMSTSSACERIEDDFEAVIEEFPEMLDVLKSAFQVLLLELP